jgi:hypothetical protein
MARAASSPASAPLVAGLLAGAFGGNFNLACAVMTFFAALSRLAVANRPGDAAPAITRVVIILG